MKGVLIQLFVLTAVQFTAATVLDSSCFPDDSCLQMGQQFAEFFAEGAKNLSAFDYCSNYSAFGDCMQPVLHKCQGPNEWTTIAQTMDNICKLACSNCSVPMSCLAAEYQSIYSQLCREMFEFNMQQKTHSECRWLLDKLLCEHKLIASACGDLAGNLYMSVVKVVINNTDNNCTAHLLHSYNITEYFQYSVDCPVNVTMSIYQCATDHILPEAMLLFRDTNPAIVDGNEENMTIHCSHYENFRQCLDNISTTCPVSVQKYLQINSEQRLYNLIMNFVCKVKRTDYMNGLYCYQDVFQTGNFSFCENIWAIMNLKLSTVTAYQFYCLPNHPNATSFHQSLKESLSCYEDVVRERCGDVAATTLSQIMKLIANDPSSLAFQYYPDCTAHHPDSMYTSTQPSTQPTTLSTTQTTSMSSTQSTTLSSTQSTTLSTTQTPSTSSTQSSSQSTSISTTTTPNNTINKGDLLASRSISLTVTSLWTIAFAVFSVLKSTL